MINKKLIAYYLKKQLLGKEVWVSEIIYGSNYDSVSSIQDNNHKTKKTVTDVFYHPGMHDGFFEIHYSDGTKTEIY